MVGMISYTFEIKKEKSKVNLSGNAYNEINPLFHIKSLFLYLRINMEPLNSVFYDRY